jgi:trehalose 6-phosphate phosphatase
LRNDGRAKLDEFFRAFTGAAKPLLLLDYDGTLAPFRVDRFQARPWAGVRELLTRIQNQGRTRMIVVTGRPAAEILPLLGVDPATEVWGLHGAERLHADGRRDLEIMSTETQAKLDALCAKLRDNPLGGLVEEKPNAVAMHWRGVARVRANAIEKRTRALFEPLAQMDGLYMIRFSTAGESHGEALIALISGLARRRPVDLEFVNRELWRRQQGYGRGGRMKIETDKAHVLSGVRHGKTIGSPIAIELVNRDWKNWEEKLPVEAGDPAKHQAVASPRPATPTWPARSNTTSPTRATCWSAPRRASPRPAWPPALLPS